MNVTRERKKTPLISVVAASNELPDDGKLNANYHTLSIIEVAKSEAKALVIE